MLFVRSCHPRDVTGKQSDDQFVMVAVSTSKQAARAGSQCSREARGPTLSVRSFEMRRASSSVIGATSVYFVIGPVSIHALFYHAGQALHHPGAFILHSRTVRCSVPEEVKYSTSISCFLLLLILCPICPLNWHPHNHSMLLLIAVV